ncbi:hypothetical protein ACGFMM_12595 [Streptomyces sp. NPDC048604]|uniref:hypothetical protein n=1 Tax=Streptomyces sp. NPDC048604 TaxID=3365578 RepID=UPI0037109BC2
MLRHEFRPGRLLAGVTALGVATLYGGDAAGTWSTPWYAALPLTFGGMTLAGLAAWAAYGVRRRGARRSSSDQ